MTRSRKGSQQTEGEGVPDAAIQGLVNTEVAGVREEIRSEMNTLLAEFEKKLLDQLKNATEQMSGQPNEAAIRELVAEAYRQENTSPAESGGSLTGTGSKGSRGLFPTIEMAKKERQRLIGHLDRCVLIARECPLSLAAAILKKASQSGQLHQRSHVE